MIKFSESKPKVFHCENCGVEIPVNDCADIVIREFSSPSRNSLSRQTSTKQVFRVKICKDCVDKAETVISGWLDKGEDI